MPSVLFLNRVYPPDHGATGVGIRRIASRFLQAGWEVSVVAAGDNASSVTLPEGIRIIRCGGGGIGGTGLLGRAFASMMLFPRLLARLLLLPRHDVVVTMTDPPLLFLLGPVVRWFKGSHLIHWAHDLYPDVAAASGVLATSGMIYGCLRDMSLAALKAHDIVVVVGECMKERLLASGIPAPLLRIVPNTWAGEGVEPGTLPGESREVRPEGIAGHFTVMYSGNFGRAHDFTTLLDAAAILRERGNSKILFLLAGEGPRARDVREEVGLRALTNVRFLSPVPGSELSRSMGLGDLHLVTMRREMSGLVVPSKYYGIMAAGKPCLFVGPEESEIAREMARSRSGLRIPNGDAVALADAIEEFRNHPDLYRRMEEAAATSWKKMIPLPGLLPLAAELLKRDRPITAGFPVPKS